MHERGFTGVSDRVGTGSAEVFRELRAALDPEHSEAPDQRSERPIEVVPTGWSEVDALLARRHAVQREGGGLARGAVHEWVGDGEERGSWSPPLSVLTHVSRRALPGAATPGAATPEHRVCWVGRTVWPYPRTLVCDFVLAAVGGSFQDGERPVQAVELIRAERTGDSAALLERSLFVDARTPGERLWAVDTALRSPAVGVVVADATGFDMAASRRLQLAARTEGVLALFARPPWEERALSAASTRWKVRRALPSASIGAPAWTLELQRCKGSGSVWIRNWTSGGMRRAGTCAGSSL